MNKQINNLFAALMGCFFLLVSCNSKTKWSHLPATVDLKEFKQTEFLPTLENSFDEKKNSIYAAAFLYAWDSLKAAYQNPIRLYDTSSNDLKLVNQSTSHLNTLKRDEYSIRVHEEVDMVYVEAFFNKTLPFPKKLHSDKPIMFGKQIVSVFGMTYYDYRIAEFCEIPFYKDDNSFILKLKPKDNEHEILLIMGLKNTKTFADAIAEIKRMIQQGEKEKQDHNKSWRYTLNEDDIFSIPVIRYNIETNYKSMVGQLFMSGERNPRIDVAYQRTGFVLNENGAVVESHAEAVTADTASVEIERPKPKKMIFDKPFFIMVKRKDQPNPYFMMWVANAELLKKE